MTKQFLQAVKRQTTLAAKVASGEATTEEKAELEKLNAAIKAATSDGDDSSTETTLKAMPLADFKAWHDQAVKAVEDGKIELLPLIKRNLAAVKQQGVTDSDGIVAVEMPVEKSAEDVISALEARIAALESAGTETPAEETDKGDKPTAQALALEAIDTLLAKYGKLKASIEAGSFSKDELASAFDGDWALKDLISDAAAVMAKAEELKAAIEDVVPEMEKLDKGGPEDGEEGSEDEGSGDEGEESSDGDSDDEGAGEGAEKSGASEAWSGGRDLAPVATAEEQAQAIKAAKEKHGF